MAEKILADGDSKSFLLVHTELIVRRLHGNDASDDVYLHFFSGMIHGYHEYKVVSLEWPDPIRAGQYQLEILSTSFSRGHLSLINNTLCKNSLAMRDYKVVWDNPWPVVEEDLLCEHEVGNPHDTHAVAVKKVQ